MGRLFPDDCSEGEESGPALALVLSDSESPPSRRREPKPILPLADATPLLPVADATAAGGGSSSSSQPAVRRDEGAAAADSSEKPLYTLAQLNGLTERYSRSQEVEDRQNEALREKFRAILELVRNISYELQSNRKKFLP